MACSGPHPPVGGNTRRSIISIAMVLFFMSMVPSTSATEEDVGQTSQQSSAEDPQIPTGALDVANALTKWFLSMISTANWIAASSTRVTVKHYLKLIWSKCGACVLKISILSLCISLMVVACAIEQEPGPMKIWLAVCLILSWLVPTIIHFHKLIREAQRLRRVDSFFVTTAMLSFIFIKTFAIMGGYDLATLLRVPPCLTSAAWIASHWCNYETPEINFD